MKPYQGTEVQMSSVQKRVCVDSAGKTTPGKGTYLIGVTNCV